MQRQDACEAPNAGWAQPPARKAKLFAGRDERKVELLADSAKGVAFCAKPNVAQRAGSHWQASMLTPHEQSE